MSDALTLLEAPSADDPIVTLPEMKRQLRYARSDKDDEIAEMTAAAVSWLEGREGYLGRALVTQKWRWAFDCFPARYIEVPLPPLISVESVKYVDTSGEVQTMSPSDYVADVALLQGRIRPAYGIVWPPTRAEELAVRVEFTAGYGAAAAVPREIKQAVKMLVTFWFVNGGDVQTVPVGTATAVGALVAGQKQPAF